MSSAGPNRRLMGVKGMCIQVRELPGGLGSQGSGECVEYMGRQEDQELPMVPEAPQALALARSASSNSCLPRFPTLAETFKFMVPV